MGKLAFVNCEKHFFPSRLLRVCDFRVSRSQHALQSSYYCFIADICICLWISTVIIYCERQLRCLECRFRATLFNFSATVWMWLICCQFFIVFLEEDLKGAGEKNPCTTGYFPQSSRSETKLTCRKTSNQNTYLPCFRETQLNMAECNSHSRHKSI